MIVSFCTRLLPFVSINLSDVSERAIRFYSNNAVSTTEVTYSLIILEDRLEGYGTEMIVDWHLCGRD
jgi:hypothetical protein